jgi:hypothetical protein
MWDSNPRGLAPNPLSKSALGQSSMFRPYGEPAITCMANGYEPR